MVRILIADDHPMVAIGIQHILQAPFPDTEFHFAETFGETLAEVQKYKFDLLLLDINLPGGNKVAMITSLRLRQADIKILVCSAYEEALYATPYMKAGADGYICKTASTDELINAVHTVLQKRRYLSLAMQQIYIDSLLNNTNPLIGHLDKLSRKELEVMNLIASGMTTGEIAAGLSISPSAVSTYKSKIFEKLSVKNVVELKELIANITRL